MKYVTKRFYRCKPGTFSNYTLTKYWQINISGDYDVGISKKQHFMSANELRHMHGKYIFADVGLFAIG